MATLKNGSRGDDVKLIQSKLGLTPDGIFGPGTEKAVKEFQAKNNIKPDGIVGPQTMSLLIKTLNNNVILKGGQVADFVNYSPISVHITKSIGRKIKYLVIHFTAGSRSTEGSAMSNRNVFLKRQASADFCVDDKTIVQVNPNLNNYYCWAVGDGKGKYGVTNSNCISIEICSALKSGTSASMPNHEGWYFTEDALNNTIKLAKHLIKMFNIPMNNVIRHYDASRKSCPGLLGWNDGALYDTTGKPLGKKNTSEKWLEFKKKLA